MIYEIARRRYACMSVTILFGSLLSILADASPPPEPDDDPPVGRTFTDQALTGFSVSNSFGTSPTTDVFAPGGTLWLLVDLGPSSGTGAVIAELTPSLSAGWYIERCNTCGSTPGNFIMGDSGGDFLEAFNWPKIRMGISASSIVWDSTTKEWLVVENGDARPTSRGALAAATSCTGAGCTLSLGNWAYEFPAPNTDTHVLQVVACSRQATAIEQTEGTFLPGNKPSTRYSFGANVTEDASVVLDIKPSRDYPGNAGTFTTQGPAPTSWTVTGSPPAVLVDKSETQWLEHQSHLWDSKYRLTQTSNVPPFQRAVQHNAYARWCFDTDGEYIAAAVAPMIEWTPPRLNGSAWVNGSFYSYDTAQAYFCPPVAYPTCQRGMVLSPWLGVGTSKQACYVEGGSDTNDYGVQPFWRYGSPALSVYVPNFTFAGADAHSSRPKRPSRPDHRVVLFTDFVTDWLASDSAEGENDALSKPVVAVLRAAYPSDGITQAGGASVAMAEAAQEAGEDEQAAVADSMDGRVSNAIVISMGYTDYIGNSGESELALFTSSYATEVANICSYNTRARPWYLFLVGPPPIVSPAPPETTPNRFGETFSQYRAAIHSVSDACAPGCVCTYVDCSGTNCITSSSHYDSATGVYPNNAGLADMALAIESMLTGADSCGDGITCL